MMEEVIIDTEGIVSKLKEQGRLSNVRELLLARVSEFIKDEYKRQFTASNGLPRVYVRYGKKKSVLYSTRMVGWMAVRKRGR